MYPGSSLQILSEAGRSTTREAALSACPDTRPEWLEDGQHPLDWNGPTDRAFVRFAEADLDRAIVEHFQRVVRRHPDRIAVTDSDTSVTYAQLWERVSALAETIVAASEPGQLVGLYLPACWKFPLGMLACLAAGRPFVALDVHCPDDWVRGVLEDAQPGLILSDEMSPEDAAVSGDRSGPLRDRSAPRGWQSGVSAARVINLTHVPLAAGDEGWQPAELDVDEPACVLFTSGSTGRPKGIVNSQRNLLQRVAQSINAAHINSDDRFLTLSPLCTIVGVRDILTALLSGASIHVLDPQRVGARNILNVIRSKAITILFAFPALLRSIVPYHEERLGPALRLVRIGGDTTLWSDIDLLRGWLAPGALIQLIYAATEAPIMQWFVTDTFRGNDARLPIGYPLPGNHVSVIDESGRATPPGEIGELVVGSRYVALGHWMGGRCVADDVGSPAPFDQQRARGRIDVAHNSAPRCRIFRTGDLVRVRLDGFLERLGRKDRQVKISGVRVELEGVEAALRQHPGVRDVGALARKNSTDGSISLIAYIVARDSAHPGLVDELKLLMRSAPAPMRPARFYLTPEIPRLPSSKLDVRALMMLDEANIRRERTGQLVVATTPIAASDDCITRTVTQVWHRVLHTPVGGPQEDFFAAGGDSLKAIRLVMELERALGLDISLTLINEAPTFAGLCTALREQRSTRYVPLVLLKEGEGLPPVFFIHGVGGNVAELFPLARSMTYPGPVFGIQARGLARQDLPHTTVEAMASEYLREIKARQPEGPYYVCGYSFGGLVAFEMARRLAESGDQVGLVGLFDTLPSVLRWPLNAWLALLRSRIDALATKKLRTDGGPRDLDTSPVASRTGSLPTFLKSAPLSVIRVAASALLASARYRPGFYPGELKLFIPAERDSALPCPRAFWRKHARDLSIVNTTGGHLTMMSWPNVEYAAASLTRYLPASAGPESQNSNPPAIIRPDRVTAPS